MPRTSFIAAAAVLLLVPGAARAQPRLLVGGGLSSPSGSFSDAADAGLHGVAALELGIPAFPLSVRAEGEYHSFGSSVGGSKTSILDGTVNAVFSLGGVGLTPYILAGFGRYRLDPGFTSTGIERLNGFQGGFGVSIGALGFGGFAELRIVRVNRDAGNLRYIPLTVGLRL